MWPSKPWYHIILQLHRCMGMDNKNFSNKWLLRKVRDRIIHMNYNKMESFKALGISQHTFAHVTHTQTLHWPTSQGLGTTLASIHRELQVVRYHYRILGGWCYRIYWIVIEGDIEGVSFVKWKTDQLCVHSSWKIIISEEGQKDTSTVITDNLNQDSPPSIDRFLL